MFLAKAKRSGLKDILLGKVLIPKSQDPVDERTEDGKKKIEIINLNDMAFTELVLSIDATRSAGKIAFGIVKSYRAKDNVDGNAVLAWEKLSKKHDPISAPLLVKTERMVREIKLSKDEDPNIWISKLQDLHIKLEVMGSIMTDEQCMIQSINGLTEDYKL